MTVNTRGQREMKRQFASDNCSGICPEAWQALAEANQGHVPSYGEDKYTLRACDLIREFFETDCEVFFTFNGTAANSLALASLCQSYHSIICHAKAHVETDECGAPEFFSNGTKILTAPSKNGKIDLSAVEELVKRRSDIHFPKPRALSLTQATELGTVYSVDELKSAWAVARRLGLRIHMDGARFANALASLNVSPKAITWEAGVDVLCFGGSKNGLPVGEAVVFFDHDLAYEFGYRCKQAGQLASKMRFLSAPWIGMIETGALLRHARHANECAERLGAALFQIEGVRIAQSREANAVFAEFPAGAVEGLHERGWQFHTFMGDGAARLMCSWDTTDEDIEAFVLDAREVIAGQTALSSAK